MKKLMQIMKLAILKSCEVIAKLAQRRLFLALFEPEKSMETDRMS